MYSIITHMEDRNNIIVSGAVSSVAITNTFIPWNIPMDAKFLRIVCIGGGGGGSSGDISAAGAASFGGAGGGSGGFVSVIIPTKYLPPILYLQPGYGGAGSTVSQNNGGAGTAGGSSIVYGFLSSTTIPIISGNGGGGGQTTAGVNPMNGGTGGTTTRNILSYFCSNYIGVNGVAGQNGGNADVSGTVFNALSQSHFLCGGAGASGSSTTTAFAGQTITGAGELPTITGGALSTATSAATRPEGGSGVWFWKPMMGTGGAGGGSTITTNGFGGRGGDGAYGCGGGGGGGASGTGVTAGPGGNGGPGLIIINCW